jgi:hypothetical protein
MPDLLKSNVCNQSQLESELFQQWCKKIGGRRNQMHRKVWEWCYIAQALYERGVLAPGRRGLGFGVGKEPLVALFASYGCEIVATDQDLESAHGGGGSDRTSTQETSTSKTRSMDKASATRSCSAGRSGTAL